MLTAHVLSAERDVSGEDPSESEGGGISTGHRASGVKKCQSSVSSISVASTAQASVRSRDRDPSRR